MPLVRFWHGWWIMQKYKNNSVTLFRIILSCQWQRIISFLQVIGNRVCSLNNFKNEISFILAISYSCNSFCNFVHTIHFLLEAFLGYLKNNICFLSWTENVSLYKKSTHPMSSETSSRDGICPVVWNRAKPLKWQCMSKGSISS